MIDSNFIYDMAKQHGQIEKKLQHARKNFEKQHRDWKWSLHTYDMYYVQ